MNNFYTIALLVFLFCMLRTPLYAQQKTMEIVTEIDWYENDEEKKERRSLVALISALVLERMGYNVKLSFSPWARALKMTQGGQFDGLAGVYYTTQRAESLAFTDSVTTTELALFKRKSSKIVFNGNLRKLTPYKIGVVRNYTYGESFDNASYINKVVSVKSSNNLNMLLAGRVDLIIASTNTISYLMEEQHPHRLGEVILLMPIIQKQDVYFTFSKQLPNHQNLVTEFNRVLLELRADGSINELEKEFAVAQVPS